MVEVNGIEPMTPCLCQQPSARSALGMPTPRSGARRAGMRSGGDGRIRTDDPLLARQVFSH